MPIETTMTIEVPAWKCSYCDKKFKKGNVALRECLWHEQEHSESEQIHELVGRYVEVTRGGVKYIGKIKSVFKKGDMLISGSNTCPTYSYAEFDGYDLEGVGAIVGVGGMYEKADVELLDNFSESDVNSWYKDRYPCCKIVCDLSGLTTGIRMDA